MITTPRHDYIFVDESGDPGFNLESGTGRLQSSNFYTAAALHLCDDAFRDLNRHIAAFRFYTGLSRELKIPSDKEHFSRLLSPIKALADGGKNIWASAIYVDKLKYTGSYLKPGGRRPANPLRFRNYMLRRLLEFHFRWHPLRSKQYDLVLDRVELTREDAENLGRYIGGNVYIPTPTHVTHAASIYVEGLQVVHHIANAYKDVVAGGSEPEELSFVKSRDLTVNQYMPVKRIVG